MSKPTHSPTRFRQLRERAGALAEGLLHGLEGALEPAEQTLVLEQVVEHIEAKLEELPNAVDGPAHGKLEPEDPRA